MADYEWNNDMVINLMKEYAKRRCLWDVRHESYRVQIEKYPVWAELSAMFDCDVVLLKRKINSIFASHRRERAKIRTGGISTWFLYPYLSFLRSPPEPTSTDVSAMESEHQEEDIHIDDNSCHTTEEDEKYDENLHEIRLKEEPETEFVAESTEWSATASVAKPRLRPKRLHRGKDKKCQPKPCSSKSSDFTTSAGSLDRKLGEVIKLLKKSNERRRVDECDSFAQYVAGALKKHDERTQCMIKQAINNIIFEQEMKKYNCNSYTVFISDAAD